MPAPSRNGLPAGPMDTEGAAVRWRRIGLLAALLLPAGGAAQTPASLPSPVAWRSLPSPDRATASALAEGPDGTLFAGTEAGLYASRDGGSTWTLRGPATRNVSQVLRTQAGALLAGTYREGVLRSTDAGATWQSVGFEQNVYVTQIVQDPDGTLFTAVRGAVGDAPQGVFRSDDDGRTWAPAGLAGEEVYALRMPRPGALLAGTREALLRSDDGGRSWRRLGTLPTDAPVSDVVIVAGTLIAAMGAPLLRIPGGGIARSGDDGATWQAMPGVPAGSAVHALAEHDAVLHAGLGDPVNGGESGLYRLRHDGLWEPSGLGGTWVRSLLATTHAGLFAGTAEQGVFRSIDGRTWTPSSRGLRNWELVALTLDAQGSLHGISLSEWFRSDDRGRTWTSGPRPAASAAPTPWSMATGDNGEIVLGANGGVLVSADRGASWEMRAFPEASGPVFALSRDAAGALVAIVRGVGGYASMDLGRSWTRLDLPGPPVHALFASPSGARFVTTADGFWRHDARGAWQHIGDDPVWTLVSCGGALLAGTYASGLLRSTDDGLTWRAVSESLRRDARQVGYMTFTALACLPEGGILAGTLGDGVFFSADDGDTWIDAAGALPTRTVMDFAVTRDGEVFASTPAGVFAGRLDRIPQ